MTMKNSLPAKIECQVLLKGEPFQGALLVAVFSTKTKNPYSILIGPTNAEGSSIITRPAILEQAARHMDVALMDYDPIEGVFAGTIRIAVMDHADIEKALKAYQIFKRATRFPFDYESTLTAARERIKDFRASDFTVRTTVTPELTEVIQEKDDTESEGPK